MKGKHPTRRCRPLKTAVAGLLCLLLSLPRNGQAQTAEIEQLLLNVEKLAQLKSMLLDLKKGYRIVAAGYGTIKDISEGNFSLHDAYLNRLLQVSPLVQQYGRVKDIIEAQLRIGTEYRTALRQLRGSNLLTPGELEYIGAVYTNLWKGSLLQLEDLALVLTSGALRLTDSERISAIDVIWKEVEERLVFLRQFSGEARLLLLARAREKGDIATLKKFYSLAQP